MLRRQIDGWTQCIPCVAGVCVPGHAGAAHRGPGGQGYPGERYWRSGGGVLTPWWWWQDIDINIGSSDGVRWRGQEIITNINNTIAVFSSHRCHCADIRVSDHPPILNI